MFIKSYFAIFPFGIPLALLYVANCIIYNAALQQYNILESTSNTFKLGYI